MAMTSGGELSELVPVREALAQGRYDAAFDLLERAAMRPRRRRTKALYRVHLAGLYALYGDEGLEPGSRMLDSALSLAPDLTEEPLYRALYWEFRAVAGEEEAVVKREAVPLLDAADAEARYHAASALYTVGALEEAVSGLTRLSDEELPDHLAWRRWSLLGLARDELGQLEEAILAFERSVALANAGDEQLERLTLAGCLLELRRGEEALAVLSGVDEELLESDEDLYQLRYLAGRAELDRGNPNLALAYLEEARTLLGEEADLDYPLLLAEGQVLAGLGRFDEAAEKFRSAASGGPPEGLSYALHEWALALLDAGDLEGAKEQLERVLEDREYFHIAEATADLAEVELKLGSFDRAEELAQKALEDGAVAAACLTLGSIAYEYYRLEEAVTWFERAASATEQGDPVWVLSQQLLADVFAQMGPSAAERLVVHARAALAYTDASNEWYLPLRDHLETAERHLGGHDRVIN